MRAILITLLLANVFVGHGQVISTFAGDGTAGFFGDGGNATGAKFITPSEIAFDALGNCYISDASNNRIRKVDIAGKVTTIAGSTAGYGGDGGPATAALLKNPSGVAIDATGNIYIADCFNYRVRKISTSGIISTIAGTGVLGFSGDGGAATAALITGVTLLALDKTGNLYFPDGHSIAQVTPSGILHIIAGNGTPGYGGDGGQATAALLNGNEGLAIDATGNIYLADHYNNRIRRIDAATHIITTVAGTGTYGYKGDNGQATAAELQSPFDVAINGYGEIFFSDYNNNVIRKIAKSGIITTVAGNNIVGYSGDGGPATAAQLYGPYGIAFDACDNLYIGDGHNNRVRKVAFNPLCWKLGVDNEQPSNPRISIYPNPTTDILHIDNLQSKATCRVLSIVGVVQQQAALHAGSNSIDIAGLPGGIYIVELISDDGKRSVNKIVKQ
jgi:trimeric autotransporter adhesin